MAFFGMDIQQVRNLANQLEQKAQTIDDLIRAITSQLSSTDWKGPDADKFRNDWNGTLTSQLRNVARQLRATKDRANRNAQEQENASR